MLDYIVRLGLRFTYAVTLLATAVETTERS